MAQPNVAGLPQLFFLWSVAVLCVAARPCFCWALSFLIIGNNAHGFQGTQVRYAHVGFKTEMTGLKKSQNPKNVE